MEKNYMSVPFANRTGTEKGLGLPLNLIPSKDIHSVPGSLAQGRGDFAGSVRPAHHSLLASLRSPTLPDLVVSLLFVA